MIKSYKVGDKKPGPGGKYLVCRDSHNFVATVCYGMHDPWWVPHVPKVAVHHPTGEITPVNMLVTDTWIEIDLGPN